MDFKLEDLLDFSASTGDWMSIIERFIQAITDFLAVFGIKLFADETETETETTIEA